MADELMAGRRDATTYVNPGRAGLWHAARQVSSETWVSECSSAMLLDESSLEPASGLMKTEKCSRKACQAAFAAQAGEVGNG